MSEEAAPNEPILEGEYRMPAAGGGEIVVPPHRAEELRGVPLVMPAEIPAGAPFTMPDAAELAATPHVMPAPGGGVYVFTDRAGPPRPASGGVG